MAGVSLNCTAQNPYTAGECGSSLVSEYLWCARCTATQYNIGKVLPGMAINVPRYSNHLGALNDRCVIKRCTTTVPKIVLMPYTRKHIAHCHGSLLKIKYRTTICRQALYTIISLCEGTNQFFFFMQILMHLLAVGQPLDPFPFRRSAGVQIADRTQQTKVDPWLLRVRQPPAPGVQVQRS